MGRTLAAIVHQRSRPIARTQSACQATTGGVTFNIGTSHASTRQEARARVMNIRQPAPSVLRMGDPARRAWVERQYRDGGGVGISSPDCGPGRAIRLPPKGGKRILLCGGCGLRNDSGTVGVHECCDTCGTFYDYGEGSQVTHQILKDNVKGNRAGFACGATDKAKGIYGQGSVVTREYSVAPPIPGMQPPARPNTRLRVVQPPPAVKTITVPARKSYAYSTAELIKKTNIGYDANLAIRSCGRRNGCTGDCACQCSLCCASNQECSAKNGWSDGVCPGGMTGHGATCTTGSGAGPQGSSIGVPDRSGIGTEYAASYKHPATAGHAVSLPGTTVITAFATILNTAGVSTQIGLYQLSGGVLGQLVASSNIQTSIVGLNIYPLPTPVTLPGGEYAIMLAISAAVQIWTAVESVNMYGVNKYPLLPSGCGCGAGWTSSRAMVLWPIGYSAGCGPNAGPCACQSWTYKRRNNQFAANGAVDSDLLTSRIARTTQVANTCNTEGCTNPTYSSPSCDQCCKRNDSLPRTRGQVRRIPQELHQPKRPTRG